MDNASLKKAEKNKFEESQKILFIQEEEKLATKLKEICNKKGEEIQLTKSAEIIHKLGHIYQERAYVQQNITNLFMINLIKSAALYNAAMIRSPQIAKEIQRDLQQLCGDIINFAGAQQNNADLVQEAQNIKMKIKKMRNFVDQKILRDIDKNNLLNQEQQKINHIRDLQNKITKDYTQIMADLSHYCQQVMGHPPCKFTVVGMGSLARKEITPYSDFEHIIVLEKTNQQITEHKLDYFRWFSVVFQTILLNLQETILPSVSIYSLNDKESLHGDWFYDAFTTRGICFDGMMPHACKFPLGRQQFTDDKPWKTELIKPVGEMLEYLTTEADLKNGYNLKDILTKICFVYGDRAVFDNFESGVRKILVQEDQQLHIDTIKRQIMKDLDSFATRSTLLELIPSKELNLKRTVYRSSTLFISALGRAYNIWASSSFDTIEQLAERNEISETARHRLLYAVTLACETRLKWYMKCKRQNDVIKSESGKETAMEMLLTLATKTDIISYFQTAYALQCDVSKRFNLNKRFFYSNPTLLNSSLYYCLGERQALVAFTKKYKAIDVDKKNRLFNFDDCIQQLQYGEDRNPFDGDNQKSQNFENPKLLNQTEQNEIEKFALCEYFKEFGNYLRNMKKYDEALEYFYKENKILSEILNINTTAHTSTNKKTFSKNKNKVFLKTISKSQQNIGYCLMELNRLTEAFDYFKQSLDTKKRISPGVDTDLDISMSVQSIGRCLMKMNKLTEAHNYFRQSLEIKQQLSQNVDLDREISITFNDIGRCLIKMNKLKEALDYFKRSIEFKQKILLEVDTDSEMSMSLQNIGHCLMKLNNFMEAFGYFKRSLEIKQRISPGVDSDRDIAISFSDIGHCLMQLDHFSEALYYFNKSLEIRQRISLEIESDPDISLTLYDIGCCLFKILDKFKQSIENKKQKQMEFDIDQAGVSMPSQNIGQCLMQINQLKQAFNIFKESLEITNFTSHRYRYATKNNILMPLQNIDQCLVQVDQLIEALIFFKRSLEIKQRVSLEADLHQDFFSIHDMRRCLMKLIQLTEALEYFKLSI